MADLGSLGRQAWTRARELPLGRVLVTPPAPTRYLRRLDLAVRPLGGPGWTATLWISPDALLVERHGAVVGFAPREGVVATSFRRAEPSRRRLVVTTDDGVDRPLCLVTGSSRWAEVDEALARAGWPTERHGASPAPIEGWWTMCRVEGSTGWLAVEPGRIGIETPALVAWWSPEQAPTVRLRREGDAGRIEIGAAGTEPVVAVLPPPGGRSVGAALTARGWSLRG